MTNDLLLYAGSANRPLAAATAALLGIPLGNLEIVRFPDGELSPLIEDSVRGEDVFIIQPTSPPDTGRVKLAERYADALDLPLGLMTKRRLAGNVHVTHVVGDLRGRVPIVVDDIMAGGSLVGQLPALLEAGARPEMVLVIMHA